MSKLKRIILSILKLKLVVVTLSCGDAAFKKDMLSTSEENKDSSKNNCSNLEDVPEEKDSSKNEIDDEKKIMSNEELMSKIPYYKSYCDIKGSLPDKFEFRLLCRENIEEDYTRYALYCEITNSIKKELTAYYIFEEEEEEEEENENEDWNDGEEHEDFDHNEEKKKEKREYITRDQFKEDFENTLKCTDDQLEDMLIKAEGKFMKEKNIGGCFSKDRYDFYGIRKGSDDFFDIECSIDMCKNMILPTAYLLNNLFRISEKDFFEYITNYKKEILIKWDLLHDYTFIIPKK